MTESIRIGSPPKPPKRSRRRWPLVAAVSAGVLALAASAAVAGIMTARADYAAPAPTSSSTLGATMNVRGGVALTFGQYALSGQRCFGRGGYDDIAPGAQVKVTDATGKVIALGAVTYGTVTDSDNGKIKDACLMFFEVDNVPRFGRFYGVEVAHRGIVQATEEEMIGGEFTLSIG